jgi:NADPH-dependent 2,4-dienoyl-CoA reductase/sulfur reductase-like enzyme
MTVVIVGASLAGLSVARALRRRGYAEKITLIGAEPHRPYDRPPLSKDFLSEHDDATPTWLASAETLSGLDIDVRLGVAATALSPPNNQVRLDTGEILRYGHVVIATGSRARRLPSAHQPAGFHALRTLDDAVALRAEFEQRPRVAVLGGGFIGAEIAGAARRRGLDVAMIERLAYPMAGALGPEMGALLAQLHSDHGVRLHLGTTVDAIQGATRVESLRLTDGSVVPADLVVEGLGAEPVVDWLDGSGLDTTNGVICDGDLRAKGHRNIYAAGDVACWPQDPDAVAGRIEHWTNAVEHSQLVAASITGARPPEASVPYVWSDQYGRRIQIVGRPGAAERVTVRRDDDQGRHLAVYESGGRVVAMISIDAPASMARGRRAIAAHASASELLAEL